MSYSWKFTTVRDWQPETLSEGENPDTPVCLILNESNETQALLTVKVIDKEKSSYIFACKDDIKEFSNLKEAVEYIGLDSNDKDSSRFVNDVRMFVLSEQSILKRNDSYYKEITGQADSK